MQISFGPRSDIYSAYVTGRPGDLDPGATGPVIDVETFYNMTRARVMCWTFSAVSVLAPLIAFAAAIKLILWLLSFGSLDLLPETGPVGAKSSNPALPLVKYCGSNKGFDPLLNGLLAHTLHFSVTHVALFAVCGLAVVAATSSISNVIQTHKFPNTNAWEAFFWIVSLGVLVGLGYGVFGLASHFAGNQVDGLFQRLFPVPADKCDILKQIGLLKEQIYGQMYWGALAVSLGVVALILAAATLGWRFETKQINGAWSDSYVLRRKINTLLTLFFIGSTLLVVSIISLSSATDWIGGILDTIAAATTADSKGDAAADGQANANGASPSPPAQEKTQDSGTSSGQPAPAKPADPDAAEFDSLKTLKTSISTFAGALGSLLLILIFVPALYCLTGEIELAGKTHASFDQANKDPPLAAPTAPPVYARGQDGAFYEVEVKAGAGEEDPAILAVKGMDGRSYEFALVAAPGAPPTSSFLGEQGGKIYRFVAQPQPGPAPKDKKPPSKWKVAGWKTVQDWKEAHGLKLSFSDMTATFVAILAPLLSGSIIDLTKMTLG